MKFISYLTLAVAALALPFGNAFGMAQKTPSAQPNRYDRILEIIRTSAAKRDAANVKGKSGKQKGQKDIEQRPLYDVIPAGPESTQEFDTAATLGTKEYKTAQQTEQFKTAMQTGTLPKFKTSKEETQFLTALQDELRETPDDGTNPNRQGWMTWIGEQLAWVAGHPY